MASECQHDVVLFGATGFTGSLTAGYLAEHAPPDVRWAIAGRNRSKLEALRARLEEVGKSVPEIVTADVEDPASLVALAKSTRVAVSTVGPYVRHGEPLVAACAAAGTDYLDLTGEPEFVDLMYVRHHATAVGSGARLVHCAGFDSIPHDLGALFAVSQLPDDVPIALEGHVRAGGRISGGTLHSAIGIFARQRPTAQAAAARKEIEPRPTGRQVRGVRPRPRHDAERGSWLLPLPTIDPQIVLRSARALPRYGPDFSYGHYISLRRLPTAVGLAAGAAGVAALAQLPLTRRLLLGRIDPGEGPDETQRAAGWFKVRFIAHADGRIAVSEVSGGDPGYGETSKMLAESALCLALDELPRTAGQVTTAVAMGDALIARLRGAGIGFAVLS